MEHSRDEEFSIAERYFENNPKATKLNRKESNLSSSYIYCKHIFDANTKIFRLANKNETNQIIGTGEFARVKHAQDQQGTSYAIKIQEIVSFKLETLAQNELTISYHAGISDGFWSRHKNKRYQPMFNLGLALSPEVLKPLSNEIRLKLAIDLLIEVNKLHTGKIPYAHKDIKPKNIVIDQCFNLKLIDFGFSTNNIHDQTVSGTPEYMAMDLKSFVKFLNTPHQRKIEFIKQHRRTTNPFKADVIATLRTIYNPLAEMQNDCLFTQNYFNALPAELMNYLDTSEIKELMLAENTNYLTFIAALLIYYHENKCIVHELTSLLNDSERQLNIIEQYKQSERYTPDELSTLKSSFTPDSAHSSHPIP